MTRIPAVVVSGFLGSGKTTFIIRSLLPRLKYKRLSIIVNDFGQTNFDKIRLYQENFEVFGIEGNCFCCELGGEFLNLLSELKNRNIDFLIVETSGISNPVPIFYGLESTGFRVELIVGVFGLDLDEPLLTSPLVQAQIEASHCLVLTKADLVTKEEAKKRFKFFAGYQKPVFLAKDGYVEEDIETLFGQVKTEPKRTSRHDAFKSHTLTLNGFYSKLEVEEFFKNLPKSIYRAKGIIHCLGSPLPLALNYSFGNLMWERLEVEEKPFLVFIGSKINQKLFESFPRSQKLSHEHEKLCFPLYEFDARDGIAYLDGEAMDELQVAEKLLEELKDENFWLISGEGISFTDFSDLKRLYEECKNSNHKKLVFWKIPSAIVSYLLEKLPKDKLVYHLSTHYLLPKAHISLKIDTKEKERVIFSQITA